MAYQEYEFNNKFLMDYYLFLYLLPQNKLKSRKELILHFKEVRQQEYQKYVEKLKFSYNVPYHPIGLFPKQLENFFVKYRFIKTIGFYNYFIKKKREILFY